MISWGKKGFIYHRKTYILSTNGIDSSSFLPFKNGYIITWMLHDIWMFFNKVKLAAG